GGFTDGSSMACGSSDDSCENGYWRLRGASRHEPQSGPTENDKAVSRRLSPAGPHMHVYGARLAVRRSAPTAAARLWAQREDRSVAVRATELCRAVERTINVGQPRIRRTAIGSAAAEAVQHALFAGRRHAKDRSTPMCAALTRRTVQCAFHVDQACCWLSAIGAAEAVEHFFRATRRDAKDRAIAIRAACARRAVKRPIYLYQAGDRAGAV